MQLKNMEKTEKNTVVLEIAVEKEAFEDAMNQAYRKNVGKISVPGFRKGKAPRKMIEKLYGTGVFYEDAINIAYPDAYDAAVKEAAIEPVEQPMLDIVSVDEDGLVFKATVTVKPEVSIKNYKGIKAEKITYTVSKDDVNEEIEKLRQRNAQEVSVDRAAKDGDVAVIDYEGFCDGKAFDGGKDEGHSLKLGSNSFIPGFEGQVVGHKAGEEFDITVTFPTEYHSEDLAGKEAVFKIALKEVKETKLSDLDDEFAKDVSEFETFDALFSDLEAKLVESREKTSQSQFEEEVMTQMLEGFEAEIPDAMIESEIDDIARDFDYRLSMQGLNLVKYMEYTGMDQPAFRASFRDQAEKRVKTRLALEKITELEGISVSDEAVEDEYKNLSATYGMEVEQVKQYVTAENVRKDMAIAKAVALVSENATAILVDAKDKAAEGEEKPKKKAAAKTAAKPKAKKETAKDAEKDAGKPAKKPAKKAAKKDEEAK